MKIRVIVYDLTIPERIVYQRDIELEDHQRSNAPVRQALSKVLHDLPVQG